MHMKAWPISFNGTYNSNQHEIKICFKFAAHNKLSLLVSGCAGLFMEIIEAAVVCGWRQFYSNGLVMTF